MKQEQKRKEAVPDMTLGQWLIQKTDTPAWRMGKVKGYKHFSDNRIQEMINAIGKGKLFSQIRELEREGLIRADWQDMNRDIRTVHFPVENMDKLYIREGIENPKERCKRLCAMVEEHAGQTDTSWLKKYYDDLTEQLCQGKPNLAEDEKLFLALDGISRIEKDTWKRVFSIQVFGNSKLFEQKYEKKVLKVLKEYSPLYKEEMSDDQLLAEHGIMSYSQTLQWKGSVSYGLDIGAVIDTSFMEYGTILNAQTLVHARPVSMDAVRKVMTVENKANYESAVYDREILYIFVHGFPSPKERIFLQQLNDIVKPGTEFYHWGDMDYGGIRIFQFIKEKIFPDVQPYGMNREDYIRAMEENRECLIPLSEEKRTKLEHMDAGVLDELKQCILAYGYEIEQESQLILSNANHAL